MLIFSGQRTGRRIRSYDPMGDEMKCLPSKLKETSIGKVFLPLRNALDSKIIIIELGILVNQVP
jgi:hypothetical protein